MDFSHYRIPLTLEHYRFLTFLLGCAIRVIPFLGNFEEFGFKPIEIFESRIPFDSNGGVPMAYLLHHGIVMIGTFALGSSPYSYLYRSIPNWNNRGRGFYHLPLYAAYSVDSMTSALNGRFQALNLS